MVALDDYQQTLHNARWSTGDTAALEHGQLTWLVYCHRGDEKLMARGSSRRDAWQAAARMATELDAADSQT
jgi:hypothetical protein